MTRISTRRLSVVLGCLLLCHCGRKSAIRPPEDVLPKTIADLSATDRRETIELSWSRPPSYANGSSMTDLGGFEVLRAPGPSGAADFERLTVLDVSDRYRFQKVKHFHYLDRAIVDGASYRYRVVSFTLDRYFSAPSNEVTVEHKASREEAHAPLPTP